MLLSLGVCQGALRRRFELLGEPLDRQALLGQRIAVAQGDGVVLQLWWSIVSPRGADLILAAVALADRAALVVLGSAPRPRRRP